VTSEFAQRVGITRSSKAILQPVNIDDKTLAALTSDYDPNDHFDAYALYQYLLSRELAALGLDSTRISLYDAIATFHWERVGKRETDRLKASLGLATIFDLINFGYGRSNSVLKIDGPSRIE